MGGETSITDQNSNKESLLQRIANETKSIQKENVYHLTFPLCQEEAESVDHVMYSCEVAQAVWKMTPGASGSEYAGIKKVTDFVPLVLSKLEKSIVQLIFTTTWMIWNAQNELVWDQKHSSPTQITQREAAYATDLRRAVPHPQSNKLEPPPSHLYKINIAIEKKKNEPTGGMGIIIRDGASETIGVAVQNSRIMETKCNSWLKLPYLLYLLLLT